jgi:hypothetical protein
MQIDSGGNLSVGERKDGRTFSKVEKNQIFISLSLFNENCNHLGYSRKFS